MSKNKRRIIYVVVSVLCIISGVVVAKVFNSGKKEEIITPDAKNLYAAYQVKGNNLEAFDLRFLQLENKNENKIYSPLSIKYALGMLREGTKGNTKTQITNIIGDFTPKKYNNTKYMSFANALFIKDKYKDKVKSSYRNTLINKYNAEVIYDSFKTPNTLNNWVSDKTFNLIDNLSDDISNKDFILVNSLAIDMEWKNKIRSEYEDFNVYYDHQKYDYYISSLTLAPYDDIDFEGMNKKVKSAEIGAVINKYDIVSTLGEDNIRNTVGKEYENWLKDEDRISCSDNDLPVEDYLDKYIDEISKGYKQIDTSSDFEFYVDDETKVFAKDLKTYNNTTLQYIGIMPKNISLNKYIEDINVDNINSLINNLKDIRLENFKEGVITEVTGYIPMFKFDYELDLKNDLASLGITNIFDKKKADLGELTLDEAYIDEAKHKANIEFSNDGIKASAATEMGGAGADNCGFDYLYEVPVEKIDITFDKPYLFLIRDKDTKEVWFTGTVYEPIEFEEPNWPIEWR